MKAAVLGIGVFRSAGGARREGGEAGVVPLKRQRLQEAVARSALGATDEGIAEASVARIQKLGEACPTEGQIWCDQRRGPW